MWLWIFPHFINNFMKGLSKQLFNFLLLEFRYHSLPFRGTKLLLHYFGNISIHKIVVKLSASYFQRTKTHRLFIDFIDDFLFHSGWGALLLFIVSHYIHYSICVYRHWMEIFIYFFLHFAVSVHRQHLYKLFLFRNIIIRKFISSLTLKIYHHMWKIVVIVSKMILVLLNICLD